MKKAHWLLLVGLVLFTILAIRFILSGDEDTWLCQDGEWVAHGHPGIDKPTSGCGDENPLDRRSLDEGGSPIDEATASGQTSIANPASVNCLEQGGSLELTPGPDGGVQGICTLPEGQICEEWAYFRGECP